MQDFSGPSLSTTVARTSGVCATLRTLVRAAHYNGRPVLTGRYADNCEAEWNDYGKWTDDKKQKFMSMAKTYYEAIPNGFFWCASYFLLIWLSTSPRNQDLENRGVDEGWAHQRANVVLSARSGGGLDPRRPSHRSHRMHEAGRSAEGRPILRRAAEAVADGRRRCRRYRAIRCRRAGLAACDTDNLRHANANVHRNGSHPHSPAADVLRACDGHPVDDEPEEYPERIRPSCDLQVSRRLGSGNAADAVLNESSACKSKSRTYRRLRFAASLLPLKS